MFRIFLFPHSEVTFAPVPSAFPNFLQVLQRGEDAFKLGLSASQFQVVQAICDEIRVVNHFHELFAPLTSPRVAFS